MAKTEKTKKIPGAVIVIVVVIIAVVAFIPTVYMPYKTKKPTMDADHQEALDTLAYLDNSIENKDLIQSDIDDLQAQWEKYRKDMFVEPESALNDLNTKLDKEEINVIKFNMDDPVEDPSETVTAEGNPLSYSTIKLECEATREQLIEFLSYVETESVGAYYVKNLDAKTVYEYGSDSDGKKSSDIVGEHLSADMEIYLYFFDQDKVVAVESETDTEEAE